MYVVRRRELKIDSGLYRRIRVPFWRTRHNDSLRVGGCKAKRGCKRLLPHIVGICHSIVQQQWHTTLADYSCSCQTLQDPDLFLGSRRQARVRDRCTVRDAGLHTKILTDQYTEFFAEDALTQ